MWLLAGTLLLGSCSEGEGAATRDAATRAGGESRFDAGTDRVDGGERPVQTRLSGVVVDTRGRRIEAARVELGSAHSVTNIEGEFLLDRLAPSPAAFLTVSSAGYSTGTLPLQILVGTNYVRASVQRAQMATLNAAEGGEVKLASGGSVTFPAEAIVDANGELVNEPVTVAFAVIHNRDEMSAAPGGMRAIDPGASEDAPPTQLESFGMMQVSITAASKPVHLKDGTTATLRFPLAPHHPFLLGEPVELWSFGDGETVWRSEGGGAVVDSNKLEAEVSHFSWWNAGRVTTTTCVTGRVLDADGKPIAATHISAEGRSYLGSTHTTTDGDGRFCLEARPGSALKVSTLARVGATNQALAVQVNTPRDAASCGTPSGCFALPRNLVTVRVEKAKQCAPSECPVDPGGRERCCVSELGPCSYVVQGDCGGRADGAWDPAPAEPGVIEISGVPLAPDPEPHAIGAAESAPIDAGVRDGAAARGSAGRGDAETAAGGGGTDEADGGSDRLE